MKNDSSIYVYMGDLPEELRKQIHDTLESKNPRYLKILENNNLPLVSVDLEQFYDTEPFLAEIVEMNESEEEKKKNPGYIICRTYYILEHFNHPDICICLDIGEDKLSFIIDKLTDDIINSIKIQDDTVISNGNFSFKFKLLDSDNGEMVYVILADKNGKYPEDEECDPFYKNQLRYTKMIDSYYEFIDNALEVTV